MEDLPPAKAEAIDDNPKAREWILQSALSSARREVERSHVMLGDWRRQNRTSADGLESVLVDATVNLEIKELRLQLAEREAEIKKLKDELNAATFRTDSIMGRRLINKCRALQEENADLGRFLAENVLQPLQIHTAALQKHLNFVKQQMKAQQELSADLDEENDRLTQQVAMLSRDLRNSQVEKEALRREAEQLRSSAGNDDRRRKEKRREEDRSGRRDRDRERDRRKDKKDRSSGRRQEGHSSGDEGGRF